MQSCLVTTNKLPCEGVYETVVISTMRIRRGTGREINVTSTLCNVCGDDYDARLIAAIRSDEGVCQYFRDMKEKHDV